MKQVKKYRRILAAAGMLLLLAACGEESQSASSLPDLGPWVIIRESPAPSEKPDSTARPVVVTEMPAGTPAPTEMLQQDTGAEITTQPEQSGQPVQSQQPEQPPAVSSLKSRSRSWWRKTILTGAGWRKKSMALRISLAYPMR